MNGNVSKLQCYGNVNGRGDCYFIGYMTEILLFINNIIWYSKGVEAMIGNLLAFCPHVTITTIG